MDIEQLNINQFCHHFKCCCWEIFLKIFRVIENYIFQYWSCVKPYQLLTIQKRSCCQTIKTSSTVRVQRIWQINSCIFIAFPCLLSFFARWVCIHTKHWLCRWRIQLLFIHTHFSRSSDFSIRLKTLSLIARSSSSAVEFANKTDRHLGLFFIMFSCLWLSFQFFLIGALHKWTKFNRISTFIHLKCNKFSLVPTSSENMRYTHSSYAGDKFQAPNVSHRSINFPFYCIHMFYGLHCRDENST